MGTTDRDEYLPLPLNSVFFVVGSICGWVFIYDFTMPKPKPSETEQKLSRKLRKMKYESSHKAVWLRMEHIEELKRIAEKENLRSLGEAVAMLIESYTMRKASTRDAFTSPRLMYPYAPMSAETLPFFDYTYFPRKKKSACNRKSKTSTSEACASPRPTVSQAPTSLERSLNEEETDDPSPEIPERMMAANEVCTKVIKKEIIEEPESSEELGYHTYIVKEVSKDAWTVDDRGQENPPDPKSTKQQPETWTLQKAKSREQHPDSRTPTKAKSKEQQPKTRTLAKAKLIEQQPETCLSKEENFEDGWIADSGSTDVCREAPSEEPVDNAYHTDSLQEEDTEEVSKEMETELAEEADYKMYCVAQEHLDSDCTEDDGGDTQIKLKGWC